MRQKSKALSAKPSKAVPIHASECPVETSRNVAKVAVSPEMASQRIVAATERSKGLYQYLDTPQLMTVLKAESERLSGGKSEDLGPILANQTLSLQSIFARLAERALDQNSMSNIEGFMRLALRAQSQCRATVEALTALNRRTKIVAQQANFGGIQQINNGQFQLSLEVSEETKGSS